MHSVTPQPKRLGQYEITKVLAVGRTWQIYRCFDPIARSNLVLKAIPRTLLEKCGGVSRAESEARAAARLKHPGIVQIYGYGEDAGLAFLAMEYVEGWYLKERFLVPLPDAVNLIVQLLEALDYAHGQGVLHRAIKPSNLLLTTSGHLRVANFGVARLSVDSPKYAAPEELSHDAVDCRSDVFSAGVVFYELLTGAHPFPSPSGAHMGGARPASQVNASVPKVFDSVCAKALANRAEERYTSARTFSDGVGAALVASKFSPPGSALPRESVILFTSSPDKPKRESGRASLASPDSKTVLPEAPQRPPEVSSAKARSVAPVAHSGTSEPNPIDKDRTSRPAGRPSPIEQLLGKQPATLSGYLKDRSSTPDEVMDAFVSSTKALIEMYNAGLSRNQALLPQHVCFDPLGKATIQVSSANAGHGTVVLGNPRYAAPEMFSDEGGTAGSTGPAANVYALGFMFYEILLGKVLFEKTFAAQRSDLDWLRWHGDLQTQAPTLKSLLPDCPVALSEIIEAMLQKQIEKRSTDLNETLSRLRRVQQQSRATVVLNLPARKKRSGKSPTVVAMIVLLLVVAGIALWQAPNLYHDVISFIQHFLGKI
jgi:serine/threonine protein kinase